MTGAEADDSDALRARLLIAICDEAPCWIEDLGDITAAVVSVSDAATVAARIILIYGREQATRALRDAAQAIIDGRRDPETGYRRFDSIEYQLCEADADGWLEARADDLGRQM